MPTQLEQIASEANLFSAWHDVADNQPEERHKSFLRFEEQLATNIAELSHALKTEAYTPGELIPLVVEVGGRRRALRVPTLRDRIVERCAHNVLDPIVDPHLLPTVFGFRRGLGVHAAVDHVAGAMEDGAEGVLQCDIKDCFDSIRHETVLERLPEMGIDQSAAELIGQLLERTSSEEVRKGLPQGAPLSPLLCNISLSSLDEYLLAKGLSVIRYADDICVVLERMADGEDALECVSGALQSLGLCLSSEKTNMKSFEEGVSLLGLAVTRREQHLRHHPKSASLYVVENGSILRSKGKRLVVDRTKEPTVSVPVERIRHVSIFGRVGLTTPAMQKLMVAGVGVTLMTDSGSYIGRLEGDRTTDPFLRATQYQLATDKMQAREVARVVAMGKIYNQRQFVLRMTHRSRISPGQVSERLARMADKVKAAATNAEIMGYEGMAARDYFSALSLAVGEQWNFTARRRRPPPDPVNSLLSFGYTLLVQEAVSALHSSGLDPYMGFLHRPRVGRPSLALDLVEEFRAPIVDSLVVSLISRGQVTREGFAITGIDTPNCRMVPDTRHVFLDAYEKRMLTETKIGKATRPVSWRQLVHAQADAMAKMVRDGRCDYEPVRWR